MKIHGNPDCMRYKVLTSGSSANTGHLKNAATEVEGEREVIQLSPVRSTSVDTGTFFPRL